MSTTVDSAVVTVDAADLRFALELIAYCVEDIDDGDNMARLYRLEAAAGARIWVPTRDMRATEFVVGVPGLDLPTAYRIVDFLDHQDGGAR